MKVLAAAILVTLAAPASADLMFVKKITTAALKTEGGEQKAREDSQVVWFGPDRMRMERARATYVIRFDQQKLFILFPDKTYSAIDLPVDLRKQIPAEKLAEYDELAAKLATTTNVTPLGEQGTFREWKTNKFALKTTSPSRASDDVVWTTKDIEIDWDTYWKAQTVVLSLQPNGERSATEMRKLEGITVLADRKLTIGGNVVDVHEELVTFERKAAPEGLYDVPPGYTLKTFDALPDLRALAGEKRARGDGEPKRGEPGQEPEGGRKRRGDGDKGGGEKGGGDSSGGEKRRGGGEKSGG